jgi:prepilin-type N-terminal cleavage/methylation domain-containing protein
MRIPRRDDGGFTLTELLVVMTLSGIIGSVVVAAVTTGLHKQTQVQDRNDALAQARTALQRVDRDIRSTSAVEAATPTEIKLQESQSTVTRLMDYRIVPGIGSFSDLVVDETDTSNPPGVAMPAVAEVTLLTDLVQTASHQVFNFAPIANYGAPSTVSNVTCAVAGTSPTAYDPSCIGTITVSLMVQPHSLAQPISMTDNGTDLRNLP